MTYSSAGFASSARDDRNSDAAAVASGSTISGFSLPLNIVFIFALASSTVSSGMTAAPAAILSVR